MLQAFAAAFRTPDLRRKLLFSLAMIAIYRLGASVPGPGVSVKAINACLTQAQNSDQRDVYSLVNLFSGGALLRLSVFALGIMPYITASIIVQLLVVVIPRFEQLKKEGQSGQTKLTQYTRYLTIGLAILQSTGIIALARNEQLFPGCDRPVLYNEDIFPLVTMVVTMTAGTAVMTTSTSAMTRRNLPTPLLSLIVQPSPGRRAAIEVKISTDMPFPTPRSVISSPSHMTTPVPAVIVMTSAPRVSHSGILPVSGMTG